MNIKIKDYSEKYFENFFSVVHQTIEEIYPKYYPKSAVDFFHEHHSKENMQRLLPDECVLLLMENNKIIGTAACFENEIKRFFILPKHQGKGYGTLLLKELEKRVDKSKYDMLILDSSLSAVKFYQGNKYVCKDYKVIRLPDENYLFYLEMTKSIK